MSTRDLSEWAKVRTQFFDDLHDLGDRERRKDWPREPRLKFSVRPDECYVAKCLEAPVDWLWKNIEPTPLWLAVIVYDPAENDPQKVHSKHLNFKVNPDLLQIFEAKQGEMFLLTGIPCGLAGYLPQEGYDKDKLKALPTFPTFALTRTRKDKPTEETLEFGGWVRFEIEPGESGEVKKYIPEPWDHYIESVIKSDNRVMETTFNKLITETLSVFATQYPDQPKQSVPDEWLTLFIPCDHVKGRPFFINGVLISFDKLIEHSSYNYIRMWTIDICSQLASFLAYETHDFKVPYQGLGAGRELKKYAECFEHKSNESIILSEYMESCSLEKIKELIELTTLEEPLHDLEGCASLSDDYELNNSFKQYISTLRQHFPRWMAEFHKNFGISETAGRASALWCFVRRHSENPDKINLSLADIIACSIEADWSVDIKISPQERPMLLHKNYGWWLHTSSKLTPQIVLETLILTPVLTKEKYDVFQILEVEDSAAIAWLLDIKVKGQRTYESRSQPTNSSAEVVDESVSKLYLNWLELVLADNKPITISKHTFTWIMLAASALVDNNVVVLPAWTLSPSNNNAAEELLELSTEECMCSLRERHPGDMCWIILGKNSSRIIVRKTWNKANG